jgi:hypothetical protein
MDASNVRRGLEIECVTMLSTYSLQSRSCATVEDSHRMQREREVGNDRKRVWVREMRS